MKRITGWPYLVILLWVLPALGDDLPITGKLYVGLNYTYTFGFSVKEGLWPFQYWRYEWTPAREWQFLGTGSFWGVQGVDTTILITAAHVLGLKSEPPEVGPENDRHRVDGKTTYLLSVGEPRVLLGTLAFKPSEVGLVKDVDDAAFLRATDPSVLKTIKPLILSDSGPETGEDVKVWGYPGTAFQQFKTKHVTSVNQGAGFFVLNETVEEGYSGGVVLNSSGKAYGVITSIDSAHQQTTALRITSEMLKAIEWHPAGEILNHKFD